MTNHIEKAQAEIVRQRDEIHHQKEMLEEQDAVVARFTDENEGLLLDVDALKAKVNLRDQQRINPSDRTQVGWPQESKRVTRDQRSYR